MKKTPTILKFPQATVNKATQCVIFKKQLDKKKSSEVCFDSIAKNILRESHQQGIWVEITDLTKFDTNQETQEPSLVTQFLTGVPINIVAYSGSPEFARKDDFQEMVISQEGSGISATIFCKTESDAYLLGIQSCLYQHDELSVWMRLQLSDDDVKGFSKLLRVPIEHISFSFS